MLLFGSVSLISHISGTKQFVSGILSNSETVYWCFFPPGLYYIILCFLSNSSLNNYLRHVILVWVVSVLSLQNIYGAGFKYFREWEE